MGQETPRVRLRPAARLAACGWAACAVALAAAARADEVDLSSGGGRSWGRPAAVVLKADGGGAYAPFGYAGLAVSYLSAGPLLELEAGGGAGLPGAQLGVSVRKLFGEGGEFFLAELSVAGNTRVSRGTSLLDPTQGGHLWTNLGLGFEHRNDAWAFGLSGGGTFFSFTQTPAAYVHGGVGIAF